MKESSSDKGAEDMKETVEIKKSVPVVADVDVLVVGSGIAGATAAVAAARNGAKTMVIDRFGYPGGGVGPGMIGGAPNLELPDTMPDGLPGIPGEFVRRSEEYCNAPLLNHYFRDSQVMVYILLKMMQESSVQFMFNAYASDPIMEGKQITGLVVENKSGTQAIRARVVVDATGDADVAFRAGAPVDLDSTYGHPGMYFAMGNVNVEDYEAHVVNSKPDPEDIRWAEKTFQEKIGRGVGHLRTLVPYFRPAWESGEYEIIREIGDLGRVLMDHGIFRSTSGVQVVHDPIRVGKYGILGALVGVRGGKSHQSGDAAVMTALEVACRTYIFETAQFLRRHVPGFEDAYLHITSSYFHSRGGRSIVSEYPVTTADAREGQKHHDVVFIADDPEHRTSREGEDSRDNIRGFDFPYRQLLPREVEGMLVTGRAAIIQPPAMRVRWMVFLMGQAAGAAAALAARAGRTPRALDVKKLQNLLHHQYQSPMGDDVRLRELGII